MPGLRDSHNLELVGVVLVEEGDGDAHDAVVVAGNRVGEGHLDGVVVVVPVVSRLALDLFMLAELQVVRHGHEGQLLVAAAMVKVGEPDCGNVDKLHPIYYFLVFPHIVCDEPHAARERSCPHPQVVVLNQREDFFVGDCVLVCDDQEFLAMLHELGDVLAKEGEGRVGDDDVRLLQVRDALGAAEVAPGVLFVAVQRDPGGLVALEEKLDVGHGRRAVAVLVLHLIEDDGERPGLLAFAIPLVVFREQGELTRDGRAIVAGGDEPFEAELVEVGSEILEEVALEGVVAVAVDDLATEGVGVELQVGLDLFLDVDVLGVELVLPGRFRGSEALVERLAFHRGMGLLEFA